MWYSGWTDHQSLDAQHAQRPGVPGPNRYEYAMPTISVQQAPAPMTVYQAPTSQPLPQGALPGSGEMLGMPANGVDLVGVPMENYAKLEDGHIGDAAQYFWEHQGEDHEQGQ